VTPEFQLIEQYFARRPHRQVLGIGDDCALIAPSHGKQIAISTDTLVAGVHFFADVEPESLGHKALAVNLSDLAAMGATPRVFTLALTLPQVDDVWLTGFAGGMFALAERYAIDLVGGDTTRGPLSITITVLGEVEPGRALRRDQANDGDDVWVSGSLGGAALALKSQLREIDLAPADRSDVQMRLDKPMPRITLGRALCGHASAAIDLSDGLVADLGHIARASGVHADISWRAVPLHPALHPYTAEQQQACALAGGDDYELCFCAAPDQRPVIESLAVSIDLALTRIGQLRSGPAGVSVRDIDGSAITLGSAGYDHFGAR
jgi:thiamine-monophosphate kinase